jgi:hypothetical protein
MDPELDLNLIKNHQKIEIDNDDLKIHESNIFVENHALKCHEKTIDIVGIVKEEYLGSDPELDPELFANQSSRGWIQNLEENGTRIDKKKIVSDPQHCCIAEFRFAVLGL